MILLPLIFIFIFASFFYIVRCPKRNLKLGGKELSVEIASNSFTRAIGLMGRLTPLAENTGMLFIFDRPARYAFWMFGTFIPLEAIFIDENGVVVDIIEMTPAGLNPLGLRNYAPKSPATYVLEVNSGFSKKYGVEAGKYLGKML